LAKAKDQFLEPTISVVTHTCGDPRTEVRKNAFETLLELGVDDQRRAEIGIGCGKLDLAVRGLELLTHSANAKTRNEILKQSILEQPANVAFEAAKMLNEHAGSVETCKVCLESPNLQLAVHAVSWVERKSCCRHWQLIP